MAENAQQEQPVAESTTVTVTHQETKNNTNTTDKSSPPSSDDTTSVNKMESQKEKSLPGTTSKNIVSGILSIFSFVLSLALLAYAVWLFYMRDYDCEDLLGLPRVQIWVSVCLILVFLLINVALILRRKFPMPVLVLIVVSLVLMLFMGLAYVGVNEMQSRRIPATPMWFKLKVRDDVNWNNIKSCIYDKGSCYDLVFRSFKEKSYDFSVTRMSSVESGCCKPPATCGMEYINATYWERKEEKEEIETDYYNGDCDLWRNDRSILCYDCRACREGFMKALRRKWWQLGVFFVVMSILLLLSHFLLFLATFWERYKA